VPSQISFIIVEILPHHTVLKIKHCLNTEVHGTEERRKEGGDNCSVWEGGPMAILTIGEGWNGWLQGHVQREGHEWGTGVARDNMGAMSLHVG
jgi:hypothetical protein